MTDHPRHPPTVFDAVLEVLVWGRHTYVVVTVTDQLVTQARSASTRRVEGTLDDVPVNLGLNRADVTPQTFVYVGSGLRRRLGARAGDLVRCSLAPADPERVPIERDVAAALEQAGRREAFDELPAARRRQLLAPIEGAVRPETRARRIAALVAATSGDLQPQRLAGPKDGPNGLE